MTNNAKKRKRASDDTSDRTPINKRHDRRSPLRTWCESSELGFDSEGEDTAPVQKLLDVIALAQEDLLKDEADLEVKQALRGIERHVQFYRDRIPKVAFDIDRTQRLLNDIGEDLSDMWKQITKTNKIILAKQNV